MGNKSPALLRPVNDEYPAVNMDIDHKYDEIINGNKFAKGMYENKGIFTELIRRATNLTGEFRDNWQEIIKYNAFKLGYNYHSLPMDVADYKPIITVYKLARVMTGRDLNTTVAALLTLQVNASSKIAVGSTGEQLSSSSEMVGMEKYCVNSAFVNGVQFIGPFADVRDTVKSFAAGESSIISNFDPNFKYVIGSCIIEGDFGKQGRGCICGIHVFVSKAAAIKYLNTGFTGIDLFSPYMGVPIMEQGERQVKRSRFEAIWNVDVIMDQYHRYNNELSVNQSMLAEKTGKAFGSWYS